MADRRRPFVRFDGASSVTSSARIASTKARDVATSRSQTEDSSVSSLASSSVSKKLVRVRIRLILMLIVPFVSVALLSALLLPSAVQEERSSASALSAASASEHVSHLIRSLILEARVSATALMIQEGYTVLTYSSGERSAINHTAVRGELFRSRASTDVHVVSMLRTFDESAVVWQTRSISSSASQLYDRLPFDIASVRYAVDRALGVRQPVAEVPGVVHDHRARIADIVSFGSEGSDGVDGANGEDRGKQRRAGDVQGVRTDSPLASPSRVAIPAEYLPDVEGDASDAEDAVSLYGEQVNKLLELIGAFVLVADTSEASLLFVLSHLTASLARTSALLGSSGWTALTRGKFRGAADAEQFVMLGGQLQSECDAILHLSRESMVEDTPLKALAVLRFSKFVGRVRASLMSVVERAMAPPASSVTPTSTGGGAHGAHAAPVAPVAPKSEPAPSPSHAAHVPAPTTPLNGPVAHASHRSGHGDGEMRFQEPVGAEFTPESAADMNQITVEVVDHLTLLMSRYFELDASSIAARRDTAVWWLVVEIVAVLLALGVTIILGVLFSQQIAGPFMRQQQMEQALKSKVVAMVEHEESLSRFVSSQMIQLLRKRNFGDVLLGDHVLISLTIMFSEVWHFTTLSERFSPMETFQLVNSFYSRTADHYQAAGGMIDKYLGDGVLSLFTDVGAAINVANALHDVSEQVSRDYRVERRCGFPFQVGVGIHSGDVVLGTVGSAERMDVTMISDAANTASRIESYTRQYHAPSLLSDAAKQRLSDDEHLSRFVGSVCPKGKQVAVKLYEPISADTDVAEAKKEYLSLWRELVELAEGGAVVEAARLLQEYVKQCPVDEVAVVKLSVLQRRARLTLSSDPAKLLGKGGQCSVGENADFDDRGSIQPKARVPGVVPLSGGGGGFSGRFKPAPLVGGGREPATKANGTNLDALIPRRSEAEAGRIPGGLLSISQDSEYRISPSVADDHHASFRPPHDVSSSSSTSPSCTGPPGHDPVLECVSSENGGRYVVGAVRLMPAESNVEVVHADPSTVRG